ncbi:hypothetical protein OFN40_32270, partial [Escherichia coli]|nr:hypothetical protein [Escherichia coli]
IKKELLAEAENFMKITTGYPPFTAQYPKRQKSLEWISPENNIRGSNAANSHQRKIRPET